MKKHIQLSLFLAVTACFSTIARSKQNMVKDVRVNSIIVSSPTPAFSSFGKLVQELVDAKTEVIILDKNTAEILDKIESNSSQEFKDLYLDKQLSCQERANIGKSLENFLKFNEQFKKIDLQHNMELKCSILDGNPTKIPVIYTPNSSDLTYLKASDEHKKIAAEFIQNNEIFGKDIYYSSVNQRKGDLALATGFGMASGVLFLLIGDYLWNRLKSQ